MNKRLDVPKENVVQRKILMSSDNVVPSPCDCTNNYQYIIYAGLSFLVVLSETLGISKYIKPNSISEAVFLALKEMLSKGVIAARQLKTSRDLHQDHVIESDHESADEKEKPIPEPEVVAEVNPITITP